MNARKLAATLTEDGTLVLNELPFHVGDTVEIILLERPKELFEHQSVSKGTALQNDNAE